MKSSSPMPDPSIRIFAETLLAGTHSPKALAAEFGVMPDGCTPVDLSQVAFEDLKNFVGDMVAPTPGIAAYLASGDPLTQDSINQMESAMEAAFGITSPWCIIAHCEGKEGKDLKVGHFYLAKQ